MIIYYRISDGSYPKIRFQNATKEKCLKNFLNCCFDPTQDKIFLYADNVKDETYNNILLWINNISNINIIRSNAGSSAGSFRLVFEEALKLDDNEIIWFQEDDYIYLPNARKVALEGIQKADYVSLYDHADTYIPASKGGNPFVTDDGYSSFPTFVIRTESSHWRTVVSTTMTFVVQVKTLKENQDVWRPLTQGTYPQDFQAFLELTKNRGRSLITPIPGLGTHAEPQWAAPGIDWEKVL